MKQVDDIGGQDLREMFAAAPSWLEKSASDIDARSLVLTAARKPCKWVSKLNESELLFLKQQLVGKGTTSNCKDAQELVSLGILGTRNGTLFIPGSVPFASIKRTIAMDELA